MSTRAAKIYDFTIPAGGSRELLVEGSYYRILTSTGALEVRRDGGSALGPIYPGQGERAEFKRLQLRDLSGAANIGNVIVADDGFIDDRITGEVTVIDANAKTTLANRAFVHNASQVAVAGQFSHVQVWNMSTVNYAYVRGLVLTPTVQSGIAYGFRTATLATVGNFLNSKKAGGSASVGCRMYTEANVADLVTTHAGYIVADPTRSTVIDFREPLLLAPNTGLVARPSGFNIGINVQFEVVEESI